MDVTNSDNIIKSWDQEELATLTADELFRYMIHTQFVNDEDRLQANVVIGTDEGELANVEFEIRITNISAVTGN